MVTSNGLLCDAVIFSDGLILNMQDYYYYFIITTVFLSFLD